MKITILDKAEHEEAEVIIKCDALDDNLIKLINSIKGNNSKMPVYQDKEISFVSYSDIYYFEAVDAKVFAYCKSDVFEVKSKLYELIDELPSSDFVRISKSVIVNIKKIKRLSPALGGRFEALLFNDEKLIISRQYVPDFKKCLGI